MKPEMILQSDVLDIIFDGRNKDYGAYDLRRYYNRRLMLSIGIMSLLAAAFFVIQRIQSADKPLTNSLFPPDTNISQIDLTPTETPVVKQPEKPVQKAQPQPTIDHAVPIIKKDVPETNVPTINDIEGRVISTLTNNLPTGSGGELTGITPTAGPVTDGTTAVADVTPAETGPLNYAEVMPSFNGDFRKFMLKHLRQPDDLEEGERIVVKVKFVVDAEGNITHAEILQSGRADLDAEVLRVVRKMPKWNPGMQAGRAVPVYFNLPVIFDSNP